MIVRSIEDADALMVQIASSAAHAQRWMAAQIGDALDVLRLMKFEPVGVHPIGGHRLNLVEQINQTWTYAAAIAAARELLLLHPDAEGFSLAPGAHRSQPLDIMSVRPGLVGAEAFAAVSPKNNKKLAADLAKLKTRGETHRYVFFLSPQYPIAARQVSLETSGIQVWSVRV